MIRLTVFAIIVHVATSSLMFVDKTHMPIGRAHMASATVGHKVYFFGGFSSASGLESERTSLSYDTLTNQWATLQNFSRAVYGACAVTDSVDSIWVFGGYGTDVAHSDVFGKYSISTDSWTFGLMPNAIWEPCCMYDEATGLILLTCGIANSPKVFDRNFHVYDPIADSFTTNTSLAPNYTIFGAGTIVRNEKLWILSPSNEVFFQLSITGEKTDLGLPYPNLVDFTEAMLLNDIIWFIGGRSTGSEFGDGSRDIVEHNITANTWRLLTDSLPAPRNGVSAHIVGPSAYVFGGWNADSAHASTWMIPCIIPSYCEQKNNACVTYECSAVSGQCEISSDCNAPVALPSTIPINVTPSVTPVKQPTGQTSNGFKISHLSLVAFLFISSVLL